MPSRPTKKMLIVPFVNPFSQKEESIGEKERERSWPQLLEEKGREGVRRLAGQVVPTPRAHCISSGEERRGKGEKEEEEEMDSLKEEEEGKAFPSFRFWGFGGNTIHPWLDCENGEMHFCATPRHRDVVTRQFPSPSSSSSLALPGG